MIIGIFDKDGSLIGINPPQGIIEKLKESGFEIREIFIIPCPYCKWKVWVEVNRLYRRDRLKEGKEWP